MRAGKGEGRKLAMIEPAAPDGDVGTGAPLPFYKKGLEGDSVAGDRVPDGAERLDRDGLDSKNILGCPLEAGIPWRQLDIGELPQMRVDLPGGPLADQEAAPFPNDEGSETTRSGLRAPGRLRQLVDTSLAPGDTAAGDRAEAAPGLARGAYQGAQFDERLAQFGAGTGTGDPQGLIGGKAAG